METRTLGERVAEAKREIRSRSLDGIERRTFRGRVELRDSEGDGSVIFGYGYVFNSLSENLGGFREVIESGAGAEVIANDPDVRGLINHNPDLILGRTKAGTMKVGEDSTGGWYEIDPPDTSYANDLRVSLARGDIDQSSFAFRVARGGDVWEDDEETGLLLRRIQKFSALYDESPVTYPAYPETSSGVRTAPNHEREDDEPAEAARRDGVDEERQAAEATWRLSAVQRRMSGIESLGEAPAGR